MYRKVKKAWVVLDANKLNHMYVQFDEPYELLPIPKDARGQLYVHVGENGMVQYGSIDETGKWWSSRAGVVNKQPNAVHCVDITEVQWDGEFGVLYTAAITLGFADQILRDFQLPFHYERFDDMTDITYFLLTNDETWPTPGTEVQTEQYGTVTIMNHTMMRFGQGCEMFNVRLWEGNKKVTRTLSYEKLPDLYPGFIWQQFQDDLKKVNQ